MGGFGLDKLPITWTRAELDQLIARAFEEDLTGGDITSEAIFRPKQRVTAQAVAKAPLVVCGLPVAQRVFAWLDPEVRWQVYAEEGALVAPGTVLFSVEGAVRSVLSAERIALNLMQHLCGIATHARQFADAVEGLATRVVDTRKTLPGLRVFQRYAVRVGGCHNHRYNLGSGVLIKENHIRAAGSIAQAIKSARDYAPHLLKVEVEVTNLDELLQALSAGADVVLLDNMSNEMMREAVQLNEGRALLEASGNVSLERVRSIAETGVDFVSVGALTHSVRAADISLLVSLDALPQEDTSSSESAEDTENKGQVESNEQIEEKSDGLEQKELVSGTEPRILREKTKGYDNLDVLLSRQEAEVGSFLPAVRPFLLEVSADLAKCLGIAKGAEDSRFEEELMDAMRQGFYGARGIRVPKLCIQESQELEAGHFACWIEGALVGAGEIPVEKILVGLAPHDLKIFQVEARKTHHPLTLRDVSWVSQQYKERLKKAALPLWDVEEVMILHLTAILERHAELFLGTQALKTMLDMLRRTEPSLVELVFGRYSMGILRQIFLILAMDRVSLLNLRRVLESLLEVDEGLREPEVIADQVRRVLRRFLCQSHVVQDMQLLVYALDPTLETLLAHLFLGRPLTEDLQMPSSLAPIQALYDALLRRFRALPSGASTPLLLVRDHSLRRPLQRVLQRAFPFCGVLSWQEIEPDYDVMVVENLERDVLEHQRNQAE